MSAEMRTERSITESNVDHGRKRIDVSVESHGVDEGLLEKKRKSLLDTPPLKKELPTEEKVIFTPKSIDRRNLFAEEKTEETIKEKFEKVKKKVDDLVDKFQAGENTVINELFKNLDPLVKRYVKSRYPEHRNRISANDIAQEILIAVHTSLPTYERKDGKPFLSFVYGIAAHKVADAHRAQRRDKSDASEIGEELHPTTVPVEDHIIQSETTARIIAEMANLPSKQKEIVALRVLAGYSAQEVADMVGTTPGAVRIAQHRAMARLRKRLEGFVEEEKTVREKK